MPEPESQEPVVETPVVEETKVEEIKPVETAVAEGTQQATETAESEPQVEPEPIPEPKKYKLKVRGEEIEADENEVVEYAQKGIDYQRRTQALSEIEKANQLKLQVFDQLASNPEVMKMVFAQSQGFDPSLVMDNPQPPPEALRDYSPEYYYDQLANYKVRTQQKQALENATQAYLRQTSVINNGALFEKARIESDLNETEFQEVTRFVQNNIMPNSLGLYSEKQLEAAVAAVVGKGRIESDRLKQANKIQAKIQQAKPSPKPTRAKAPEPPDDPKVQDAIAYKEYVKQFS